MNERKANFHKLFDDIINTWRVSFAGVMELYDPKIQKYILESSKLLGKDNAGITSSFPNENFGVSIRNTIQMVRDDAKGNQQTLGMKFINTLLQIFAIQTHDILEDALRQVNLFDSLKCEPMMQFLNQIRNGCAHGNILNFHDYSPPRYPTYWRGKIIDKCSDGQVVMGGLLIGADLFFLLEDISNLIESKL